jgi:hypothetical protein
MINVNMKRYVKLYVGGSQNKKRKDTPIAGLPLQEKAPNFYEGFTEKTSGVRANIDGTDRWRNRKGVRQFRI